MAQIKFEKHFTGSRQCVCPMHCADTVYKSSLQALAQYLDSMRYAKPPELHSGMPKGSSWVAAASLCSKNGSRSYSYRYHKVTSNSPWKSWLSLFYLWAPWFERCFLANWHLEKTASVGLVLLSLSRNQNHCWHQLLSLLPAFAQVGSILRTQDCPSQRSLRRCLGTPGRQRRPRNVPCRLCAWDVGMGEKSWIMWIWVIILWFVFGLFYFLAITRETRACVVTLPEALNY